MTTNYISPAWPSTIERGIQASHRVDSDLDRRHAAHPQRTRASDRYHKRVKLREAAMVESIATHGIK